MREFKEIKEEILIRSKKRIIRRKRIIFAAVTLCVCCVVGVAVMAFNNPPIWSDNMSEQENYDLLADEELRAVSEKITKIEYGENEFTDPDKITQITNALQFIIDSATDDSENFDRESVDNSVKMQSVTDASADMSLNLFIVTESGNKEEFIIGSNTLINKSTGVVYSMKEEDRQALLDAVK